MIYPPNQTGTERALYYWPNDNQNLIYSINLKGLSRVRCWQNL